MTKTDWTAEEVRAQAKLARGFSEHWQRCLQEEMLNDLAERIEADERAVPVAWMRRTIRHKRIGGREEGERVMSASKVYPDDEPLFTHPPAQAAQEQSGWKVPEKKTSLQYQDARYRNEAIGYRDGWNECCDAMLAASPTPPKEK